MPRSAASHRATWALRESTSSKAMGVSRNQLTMMSRENRCVRLSEAERNTRMAATQLHSSRMRDTALPVRSVPRLFCRSMGLNTCAAIRNAARPTAQNCDDRVRPQASTHTASMRTATSGRRVRFAKVTWTGSKLPDRTVLCRTEPLPGRSRVARLPHGGRYCAFSCDRRSAPAGFSDIAALRCLWAS